MVGGLVTATGSVVDGGLAGFTPSSSAATAARPMMTRRPTTAAARRVSRVRAGRGASEGRRAAGMTAVPPAVGAGVVSASGGAAAAASGGATTVVGPTTPSRAVGVVGMRSMARSRSRTWAAEGRSDGARSVMSRRRSRHASGTSVLVSGSRTRRATAVSCAVPVKALRPVSSSSRTRPSEYTSAAGVTSSPWTCSGAMYAAVPTVVAAAVTRLVSINRAIPKSARRARPSGLHSTLAGVTSRCTTPWSCT